MCSDGAPYGSAVDVPHLFEKMAEIVVLVLSKKGNTCYRDFYQFWV